MNRDERQYIEYRPQLGLKVNVRLILNDLGQDQEQIYEAPAEIMDATQHLASDVFDRANAVTRQIDALLEKAASALVDDSASPVPFAIYANDPSPEDKEAFEEFHGGNVNGKMEGELFPVLQGAKADVQRAKDYLNKAVYGGTADTENPDVIRAREMKEVEQLVRQNIMDPDNQDLSKVKMKSEMVQAMADVIDVAGAFVANAADLMNLTVADALVGEPVLILTQLARAPAVALTSMSSMSNMKFEQRAALTASLIENIDRLGGEEVQQLLFDELTNLSKLKSDAAQTIAWMSTVDTQYDTSPMANMLEEQLEVLEELFDAYDDVLEDMHKLSRLKESQYEDLTDTLGAKESSRQTTLVVGNMQENFDFEDSNQQRQVNRFIDNTNLNNKRL